MNLGEYRPPNQINKDEDKYWKFTKIQIIYMLAGFMIGAFLFRIISLLHVIFFNILAILICLILVAAGTNICHNAARPHPDKHWCFCLLLQ